MNIEKIVLNKERNVYMLAYTQSVGGEFGHIVKRPAMVVLPGGGYTYCSEREAEPVALAYLARGYQAFVLYYSVNVNGKWPNPLEDYDSAVDVINSRAEEWNVYTDKIACIGFSAGGHLAACAASSAKNKPSAAVLVYPGIRDELFRAYNGPNAALLVNNKTSPCLLITTRTDKIVDVRNTVEMQMALADHNVPFESHIYSYASHGFSTARSEVQPFGSPMSSRVMHWIDESIGWLEEVLGTFGNGFMTEPANEAVYRIDNESEYLSLDCSIDKLWKNPQAKEVLKPLFLKLFKAFGIDIDKQEGLSWEFFNIGSKLWSLRGMADILKVEQTEIDALAEALSKIKNTQD